MNEYHLPDINATKAVFGKLFKRRLETIKPGEEFLLFETHHTHLLPLVCKEAFRLLYEKGEFDIDLYLSWLRHMEVDLDLIDFTSDATIVESIAEVFAAHLLLLYGGILFENSIYDYTFRVGLKLNQANKGTNYQVILQFGYYLEPGTPLEEKILISASSIESPDFYGYGKNLPGQENLAKQIRSN